MSIIKSISGIRGTIGGKLGVGLDPIQIMRYTLAYGSILRAENKDKHLKVVLGRDGRISGAMLEKLVSATLNSIGIDVIVAGKSTTPTIEMAVTISEADGGIILTASHNPKNWNALKFFNNKGEFIDAQTGKKLLAIAQEDNFEFANEDNLGKIIDDDTFMTKHVEKVCELSLVNASKIEKANFSVVVDAINSTGALIVPILLDKLGVKNYHIINGDVSGNFAHNPEPLPEHLSELSREVVYRKADLGISVDPDVDRLAFIDENGDPFGEEYTLVSVADYILSKTNGNTVSNLSSSMALRDITVKTGNKYYASSVGEINVIEKMKEVKAIIGGEGNGGVIYPELHYGRDAIVGIALFLTMLAEKKKTVSIIRTTYPSYYISKNKLELPSEANIDEIFESIRQQYNKKEYKLDTSDGLKIDFGNEWVQLRKSNTEQIIRIYSESDSMVKSDSIANKLMSDIKEILS